MEPCERPRQPNAGGGERGGQGRSTRGGTYPASPGATRPWGLASLRSGGGALGVALMLAGVLGGCEAPDPLEGFPEAALAFLDPARASLEEVSPGVRYRAIQARAEPWSLHLLEVDLTVCQVGFQVVGIEPEGDGRRTVTELAREADPGVLAAVNGDFYTDENRAIGTEASGGQLRGRTARPVFAWRPGEPPRVGAVQWDADTLRVGDWALVREESDGLTELVAGFPALLEGGVEVGDLEATDRPGFSLQRHPRTGVGWDPDRERLWIVVADGRREGTAEGMTLAEFATLFRTLGVRDALNLDGGGSSTMVVAGRVVSRPSDLGGPRSVVNALVVREDPGFCMLRGEASALP
jgi:hypothetical protein